MAKDWLMIGLATVTARISVVLLPSMIRVKDEYMVMMPVLMAGVIARLTPAAG